MNQINEEAERRTGRGGTHGPALHKSLPHDTFCYYILARCHGALHCYRYRQLLYFLVDMAKAHRDIAAAYCIERLQQTDKPFPPLVICYWPNGDKFVCDLIDFPYALDRSYYSEEFYNALTSVGYTIGENMYNRDDLVRLYMTIAYTNTTHRKHVLAMAELDIAEGTQTQRGYDISPSRRASLSVNSFLEERTIISPRLALIAAGFFESRGTFGKNKQKIMPFLDASMRYVG